MNTSHSAFHPYLTVLLNYCISHSSHHDQNIIGRPIRGPDTEEEVKNDFPQRMAREYSKRASHQLLTNWLYGKGGYTQEKKFELVCLLDDDH